MSFVVVSNTEQVTTGGDWVRGVVRYLVTGSRFGKMTLKQAMAWSKTLGKSSDQ